MRTYLFFSLCLQAQSQQYNLLSEVDVLYKQHTFLTRTSCYNVIFGIRAQFFFYYYYSK